MEVALLDTGPTLPGQRTIQDSPPDFARLLGSDAWSRLPSPVRRRFSHVHRTCAISEYRGRTLVRASILGRALAHVCRCIGTPVAPDVGEDIPMTVYVSQVGRGVLWERRYSFPDGKCVVRSTKQMDAGALVEKLSAGLHMRLNVFEQNGALHFLSRGYYFRIGSVRIGVPNWFLPGPTHVVHENLSEHRFRFTMLTEHPWFGELFYQDGEFEEVEVST